jgi:hypothetical protein
LTLNEVEIILRTIQTLNERGLKVSKFHQGHIHAAKSTPEIIAEIRRLYADEGWTQGQLARHYKYSVGQIGRIVRGEAWGGYDRLPHRNELAQSLGRLNTLLDPVNEGEVALTAEEIERLAKTLPFEVESDSTSIEDVLKRRSQEDT